VTCVGVALRETGVVAADRRVGLWPVDAVDRDVDPCRGTGGTAVVAVFLRGGDLTSFPCWSSRMIGIYGVVFPCGM
jgi:hypothetical protein